MLKQIKETTSFIKKAIKKAPIAGIVLGTGLGGLSKEIEVETALDYKDIPNFPVSTVEGHQGKMLFGKLGAKPIVAMQGRFHYYEGYTMQQIAFPIRVMISLGIQTLMVSNASGGLNPNFAIGDIMVVRDHINLFGNNPLIGPNVDEFGPRFPDMKDAYDKQLIDMAFSVGKEKNIKLQKGVYAGVTGPTFETPAEYNYIRVIGADAVGMSTVPEVITARHAGIRCFAVSIITDLGVQGKIVEVTHEEVQKEAAKTEPLMTEIIKCMLMEL